jgi:predicted DNA-binding protein YlxM (UPF0122 family)
MKNKDRRIKERRILEMVEAGLTVVEIAEKEGVSRQATWEFIARRGWLPGESILNHSAKVAARDERRRQRAAAERGA